MKKEILILGIIFLFIGVGIQPAFAIENIFVNRLSGNLEDCNCQVIDNYDIVRARSLLNITEKLLKRVEIYTNFISLISKDNPEVIEDFEELSEKIRPLSEMNEELKTAISGRDYPIICDIWWNMVYIIGYPLLIFEYAKDIYPDGTLLDLLFEIPYRILDFLFSFLTPIGIAFGCW